MRKSIFLLLSLFSLAGSTAAAQNLSAKIGVILPLTGPLAEFGIATQNGIELARADGEDIFRNIQFVYEDSQYNPQTAITIFRKFSSDADVKFIINLGCPTSQAIAPLVDQAKIPTAFFCSALLLTKDRKYSFSATSPANEFAKVLRQNFVDRHLKKICIVLTQNDYLMSEFHALENEIKSDQKGQSIELLEQYTPQETDFRSSTLKLRKTACDALGVYLLPGQVRTFFEQTKSLQSKVPIFGTDIFESKEEIEASHGAMEGAVFVNLAAPSEFKSRYVAQFQNENQYTAACIFHDLALRAGKLIAAGKESTALMESIRTSGVETRACGTSGFVQSTTGEQFLRFPIVLKHIANGKIENGGD